MVTRAPTGRPGCRSTPARRPLSLSAGGGGTHRAGRTGFPRPRQASDREPRPERVVQEATDGAVLVDLRDRTVVSGRPEIHVDPRRPRFAPMGPRPSAPPATCLTGRGSEASWAKPSRSEAARDPPGADARRAATGSASRTPRVAAGRLDHGGDPPCRRRDDLAADLSTPRRPRCGVGPLPTRSRPMGRRRDRVRCGGRRVRPPFPAVAAPPRLTRRCERTSDDGRRTIAARLPHEGGAVESPRRYRPPA